MARFRRLAATYVCIWITSGGCASDAQSERRRDVPDAGDASIAERDAGMSTTLGLAIACNDSIDTVYEAPTGLREYAVAERGKVFRCATDRTLSIDDLQALRERAHFSDLDVRSTVRVYRIAYRTDGRLGEEARSPALVLLPDPPIATHPPLVVFAHGFSGFGVDQAFSRRDPLLADPGANTPLLLAAAGYPVIVPDFDGYTQGGVYGLGIAEIEAHALLDSTRALHAVLTRGSTSDQVVIVGHSQGGHAALAAQAFASEYGMFGRLTTLILFAPGWYPARFYGAMLAKDFDSGANTNIARTVTATSYFYAHAEYYDGRGKGLELFQPSKREALASITTSFAWLSAIGTTPYDYFEPAFLDSVATCALTGDPNDCSNDLAKTWTPRFKADRPHLDIHGADVVLWAGAKDVSATPPLIQCAIEKISADFAEAGSTASFTGCGDATADHQSILSAHVGWASRLIAARTLGGPEPEACGGTVALQPATGTLTCPDPPGNTD